MGKAEEGEYRLTKGIIQLLNCYRPYARMLMHLNRIIDPELGKGSPLGETVAAVNTKSLYWNPVMAADMTMSQIRAVLLHESFHLILQHLGRLRGRDPVAWNYVADKKCNQYVREINDDRAPVDVSRFILPNHDELQLTTEELYKKLPEQKIYIEYKGPDSPISGKGSKTDPNDPAADVEVQMWNNRIKDFLSKEAGKLPAGLARELEDFLDPKIPWQETLREFASESVSGMNTFTWKRFNRMMRMYDVYYPSMKGERVNIFLAADTSGSMGTDELTKVFSEAKEILEIYGDVYYLSCDAKVHSAESVESIEDLVKITRGGGGTDFVPVFKHVDEKYETEEIPPVLIYMTDGYGRFPDNEPPYPTIWVMIHSDVEPPFGRHLKIEHGD
jgi:predicted metal-dependent peptidase